MSRHAHLRAALAAAVVGLVGADASRALPGASDRSASSAQPAAAEPWSAFGADITVRRGRVDADGRPTGPGAPAITYRWEQTRTPRGWKTVLRLTAAERRAAKTLDGEQPIEHPFAVARIEDEGDGSPPKLFDRRGRPVELPGEAFRRRLASLMRADGLLPAAPPAAATSRPDLPMRPEPAASMPPAIAREADAPGRRAALERRFGRAAGRVGALDRYVAALERDTLEVLADPDSALPVEINVARDGRLRSHVAMRYATAAGGALVREALRAERLLEDGTGMRAVTEIELANVRLEPRRGR